MSFQLSPATSAATSTARRPYSPSQTSSSAVALQSDDDDDDDDYDALGLPFPAPLPRADFVAATFDPSNYLSSLGPRPQTLEDFRGELRQRSQLLSQELLELVNSRYEDFVGLGSSVAGGAEKVNEVRFGMMGLRREIESVRAAVEARENEVADLLQERRRMAREREWGRAAVRLCEGVSKLEREVGITAAAQRRRASTQKELNTAPSKPNTKVLDHGPEDDEDESDMSDEDDETDEDELDGFVAEGTTSLPTLRRRVDDLLMFEALANRLGSKQALVLGQRHRLFKVRNTLLVDLGTVLKRAKRLDGEAAGGTMKILELYRKLGASRDAVDVLKRLPRR